VISRFGQIPIKNLDKCMPPLTNIYARYDGIALGLLCIDQFVIPTLEKWGLSIMTMVHGRI